jgi:hypothetical protein
MKLSLTVEADTVNVLALNGAGSPSISMVLSWLR